MKPRKVELGEDGQALVEFALTFPIILTMVTLIMQFALVFNGTALVRYAAYNAARSAAVWIPLNRDDATEDEVQEKARNAAAISLAPISPPVFGGLFPGGGGGDIGIPGLNLANRFAYAWGTLLLTDGISIQTSRDFGGGGGGSSDDFVIRQPIHVTVDYYFALLIPPAHQVLFEFGGSARTLWSEAFNVISGGKLKALRMTGKAAFIHTGMDGVSN